MEILIQIFKQIPPFWPRLAVLIVLILLVALPQTRRLLRGRSKRLDRAKGLLELRKLELEVAKLRASSPEVGDSWLDEQIHAILREPVEEGEEEARLRWADRLKLAASGALGFVVFGVLATGLSGSQTGAALVAATLKQLVVIVPCALIASAIPSGIAGAPSSTAS